VKIFVCDSEYSKVIFWLLTFEIVDLTNGPRTHGITEMAIIGIAITGINIL
jgi:hypothetical protein